MEQRTEITNSSISPALPRQRIWELDFIRGLCVALMILDHLFYDLGFVFPQQWFADGGSGIIYDICYFCPQFLLGLASTPYHSRNGISRFPRQLRHLLLTLPL